MSPPSHPPDTRNPAVATTALAALGIVFGDIGTSPLYAFRECFASKNHAPLSAANLTGAASLIIWSLILVVSVKYLLVILRFDNRGEGGILALSTLVRSSMRKLGGRDPRRILFLGLAGAALIYADGMLTPAISVLSAVEGLAVSAPVISHWIVPASVAIIAALFAIQRFGTGKVGKLFGPVILVWFVTLAILGIKGILTHPAILLSLSPAAGAEFLIREWHHSLPILSAVFLSVTGGEALYADLGHFGAKPIRLAWFSIAFPALGLNYLGQAALLTSSPEAIINPFFLLAPDFLRLPLTVLATAAAVIASQALISGAFSLTTQAVQLGCLPRVRILQTSDHAIGQVYVPVVNYLLAIACIILVIRFGSSAELAGAYGIAIALTMAITSILFYSASRLHTSWSKTACIAVTFAFILVDVAFLIANFTKINDGGWLPISTAGIILFLLLTWLWGRKRLYERLSREALPVSLLVAELARKKIIRVPGIAVHLTGRSDMVPLTLLHNLKHNHVLHEKVILLHVNTLDIPRADPQDAATHEDLGDGLTLVTLCFGFAETPDVVGALKSSLHECIRFNPLKASYFVGRESYQISSHVSAITRVRLAIFALMSRNATPAHAFFALPGGRVVELGARVTL